MTLKKHILLIDDDEDELEILTQGLKEAAIQSTCTWAKNAEQAIQLLQNIVPDSIFIDFNIPKVNGLKTLEQIKKINKQQDVPIVIYSNYIDTETNRKATELGAFACIKKPSSHIVLAQVLKEMLLT